MERIKNLEQIILKPDVLLAEVIEVKTKSNIILPGVEKTKESLDYLKVVSVGSGVTDLEKGDIIVDMNETSLPIYVINGKKYAILYRGNIRIAVKAENFNADLKVEDKDLTV